jgi:hypothetical protein
LQGCHQTVRVHDLRHRQQRKRGPIAGQRCFHLEAIDGLGKAVEIVERGFLEIAQRSPGILNLNRDRYRREFDIRVLGHFVDACDDIAIAAEPGLL